eukprot:61418-Rhodomonas_salina.1
MSGTDIAYEDVPPYTLATPCPLILLSAYASAMPPFPIRYRAKASYYQFPGTVLRSCYGSSGT